MQQLWALCARQQQTPWHLFLPMLTRDDGYAINQVSHILGKLACWSGKDKLMVGNDLSTFFAFLKEQLRAPVRESFNVLVRSKVDNRCSRKTSMRWRLFAVCRRCCALITIELPFNDSMAYKCLWCSLSTHHHSTLLQGCVDIGRQDDIPDEISTVLLSLVHVIQSTNRSGDAETLCRAHSFRYSVGDNERESAANHSGHFSSTSLYLIF